MIRKINVNDISSLVELEKNFKSPLTKEFFIQELENPISNYLCYEEKGLVVGYIGFWTTGEILNLVVDENYRNRKIGSKLLEEIIELFKIDLVLDVRISNTVAINLYKKYDFQEVYIRKNYYANNEDAIVMVRRFK